jgi:hypothetical protein
MVHSELIFFKAAPHPQNKCSGFLAHFSPSRKAGGQQRESDCFRSSNNARCSFNHLRLIYIQSELCERDTNEISYSDDRLKPARSALIRKIKFERLLFAMHIEYTLI